ncbi:flavodoxin [Actinomycetaceae bacterium WB03_NA08]|uniref:Flavodoxin n=1 Tax=Scrofimicrobium canadense TaxID=2652290 RepID=A0A6N7VVQ0_9ACTO|nr:flavodoxin domain-containing protein [Scrofimicrobium canadense]MSS85060.1 flavodoxin [Scrofimicrobium canadense]
MKVLVTAASKHGSASEIASAIAARLRRSGLAVDSFAPESVQSLAEYDAVVIGSAVYMRQWMEAARDFVARFHGQLRQMPTWAFSVGMSGVPKRAPQDPKKIGPVSMDGVFDHTKVFAGRYDPTRLSLRERSIARLAGAVEGDFRDWDEVERWADSIAEALKN